MLFLFILLLQITKLSSCPLTDNYLSRCHCGILTNGESYIKCEEKSLDHVPIFKRSFPYDELILSNNNIKNLPRSSFDTIKTIRRINLENNSLSAIDDDLLRLLGNYLEELILTGDNHISSLEFLTRYPLKNLRILKLNRFNLSGLNLKSIFINMTKLEILSLRSCQIQEIPSLSNIYQLDLEDNQISDTVTLSTSYVNLNLARNFIQTILLKNNSQLLSLNLSHNQLNQFQINSKLTKNLKDLYLNSNFLTSFNFSILNDNILNINLNSNHLLSINLNYLPKSLVKLSINNNLLKQIQYSSQNSSSSLLYLDLSLNQIRSIEKNILFEQLNHLNFEKNPLNCNCHLEWLRNLVIVHNKINTTTWTCHTNHSKSLFLSSNFQCSTLENPRVHLFNITYVKISSEYGLLIQWSIADEHSLLEYIQISISDPYYLSPKISSNQTKIFLSNHIELDKQYHICLILLYKYTRDKYCRTFLTNKIHSLRSNEITLNRNETNINYDLNLYIMLIGSCIGGFITFLLILICAYLCFQIYKYNLKRKLHQMNGYYSKNPQLPYPIYHPHSRSCPYHHENLSNSTDSSHIDSSLSATNLKHIYQTIDDQDYSCLKKDVQVFDLWNQSLQEKR